MAGSYVLSKNDKGQYSFVLKAANGETILRSETYESKAAAENGIASVQKNSPMDERYQRKESSNGKPFLICWQPITRSSEPANSISRKTAANLALPR